MARKADFNAEEWTTVVSGPVLGGMLVSAAERGGTARELLAMAGVLQEARTHVGESELVDALLSSPPELDQRELAAQGDRLGEYVSARLETAVAVIERHGSPSDLDAYKTLVMRVAQAVAGAHREGGFLGIGGRPVTAAEDAALDAIARALGAPPRGAVIPE